MPTELFYEHPNDNLDEFIEVWKGLELPKNERTKWNLVIWKMTELPYRVHLTDYDTLENNMVCSGNWNSPEGTVFKYCR